MSGETVPVEHRAKVGVLMHPAHAACRSRDDDPVRCKVENCREPLGGPGDNHEERMCRTCWTAWCEQMKRYLN